eukprot:TRINITY_DN10224_c4_g1_i1.p1 TRINITY_DN10224_c4_g1~~TRINITY_DN10224_c4_g1_i1.p1  ORF type:complete len:250 (+),score=21.58 TRINITY_DN10224_c4_g1_i1:92-751(+)
MAATGPTQVFGQQMAADGTKGVPTFPKSHTEATTGNAAGGVSTGPNIQAAAWSAARERANQGAKAAQGVFFEVRSYVQESHCSLQVLCFSSAVALLLSSILGVINVFDALFKPMQYIFAFWNIIFAAIIIIIDGRSDWFGNVQTRIFQAAALLASYRGRALFYLYVGSINLLMLPHSWLWQLIYAIIGITLCSISVIMLFHSFGCCGARSSTEYHEEIL